MFRDKFYEVVDDIQCLLASWPNKFLGNIKSNWNTKIQPRALVIMNIYGLVTKNIQFLCLEDVAHTSI